MRLIPPAGFAILPMKSPQSDPISPLDIALGSVPLHVYYRDGRTETVQVQLHDLEEYPEYIKVITTSGALAEFAAKRPAGWAATLKPDSVNDLVEKSLELNFHSVRRWVGSRTKVALLVADLKRVNLPASD